MVRLPAIDKCALLAMSVVLFCGVTSAEAQTAKPEAASRLDLYGDPLPAGSRARLGTIRFREGSYSGVPRALAFLPDGKTLVSSGEDTPLQLWDAATGRRVRQISVEPRTTSGFALSRDGKTVAIAGYSYAEDLAGPRGIVQIIEIESGKEVATFPRESRDVNRPSLALTPDGKFLVYLGNTGVLRIEEIASGNEVLNYKFPPDVNCSIAISSNGQSIAVATGPNSRRFFLWKWQTADEPRELKTAGVDARGGGLRFSNTYLGHQYDRCRLATSRAGRHRLFPQCPCMF
jgi:WD40 repeat protein